MDHTWPVQYLDCVLYSDLTDLNLPLQNNHHYLLCTKYLALEVVASWIGVEREVKVSIVGKSAVFSSWLVYYDFFQFIFINWIAVSKVLSMIIL